MDILRLLQESGTAQIFVALALMPWLGVALMQAFSLATRDRLDDNFGARAIAALRWAEQNPAPVTPAKSAVLEYRTRVPVRAYVDDHAVIENEAA